MMKQILTKNKKKERKEGTFESTLMIRRLFKEAKEQINKTRVQKKIEKIEKKTKVEKEFLQKKKKLLEELKKI